MLSPDQCESLRLSWANRAGVDLNSIRHLGNAPAYPPASINATSPSTARKLWNFARAATKHLAAKMPETPDDEYRRRLLRCEVCNLRNGHACSHPNCGCTLERKASWAGEQCPVGRWENLSHPDWAVGVTTSPRATSYLNETLASLINAGWTDISIFAEPESNLSGLAESLHVVQRPQRLGAWLNWKAALRQLLDDHLQADKIMVVQDDTVFCRNVRSYLDASLWPADDVGIVSVYTPRLYAQWATVVDGDGNVIERHGNLRRAKQIAGNARRRGYSVKYEPRETGYAKVQTDSLWGACALIFPRHAAEKLLDLRMAKRWRGAGARNKEKPWEWANIDTGVGAFINKLNLSTWFHIPSLSQHVGEHSTLKGHVGANGNRAAIDFPGIEFDAQSLHRDVVQSGA